jgi:molybdate transport system substrate-binding protein
LHLHAAYTTIELIASNAVKEALAELVPEFEKASGHKVVISWGGTLDITARIRDGEVVDIVILAAPRIDDFIKQGRLVPGSRVDIARSGIGVAVRAGARAPDISCGAALKASLLAARSIVLSSGPSSVYLADLFQKMGIADAIKSKIHQIGPGLPVGKVLSGRMILSEKSATFRDHALARGEGEIGFTQVSELLSVEGVDYVGPLPADVQHITVFSAGLHVAARSPDAAKALVEFLTAPQAAAVITRSGMEPA